MIGEAEMLNALKTNTGCDFAQVGVVSLREKIRLILAGDIDSDIMLPSEHEEWETLLHAVLVPETWFFRNPEAFDALVSRAREYGFNKRPLRILSLPCATGEEPYSIAMTLLEAGWSPDQFQIIGGDIGKEFLRKAVAGKYRRNAFRDFDEVRYGHYFESTPDGRRRLQKKVRDLVYFKQLNLIRGDIPNADVVFCRNALIYLDPENQIIALKRIHALLPDDGALFLGPVEPSIAVRCGFAVLPYPMAFACCKANNSAVNQSATSTIKSRKTTRSTTVARNRMRQRQPVKPAVFSKTTITSPSTSNNYPQQQELPSFEEIREWADRGALSEAAEMLNQLAAAAEPTAEIYCLSGIINEANDRHEVAEQFYRKALFLNPEHTESLLHLSLMLEAAGRHTTARAFYQRLKRQQTI